MARDYYAEAKSLATGLRADAAEFERYADSIDEVIAAGFTATEILMGLRLQLRDMVGDGQLLSERRLAVVEDLANGIDEALA